MGLRETVQQAVLSGFTALGNLLESVTYKSQGTVGYTPTTTGVVTRPETDYTITGLFYEYKKQEIDGEQIKPHDMRFLCLQSVLAVTPKITDRIVRSTGKAWEVISVKEDPAHATWELQMRSTNG